MMMSAQLGQGTSVYGFISIFISPIKTKCGMGVDQHILINIY